MHAALASAAIPIRQGTGADLTDLLLALVALIVLVVAVVAAVAVHHGSTPTHRPPATHHKAR